MYSRQREQVVFDALRSFGFDVARDGYWQAVAFDMYDTAAYDDRAPDVPTLVRWLEEYD